MGITVGDALAVSIIRDLQTLSDGTVSCQHCGPLPFEESALVLLTVRSQVQIGQSLFVNALFRA